AVSAATFSAADGAAKDPDNNADTEADDVLAPDDRARLGLDDVLLTFAGAPSVVSQFKVEPRTAGEAKSCNFVVCKSDGTHFLHACGGEGVPCRINVRFLEHKFRG
ncbi:unnamed protein product, partial [Phaeothamnion confervicola]